MALDPISAALDLGNTLIQRIFPDPAQASAAKLELMKLQQNGELQLITGQLEINKEEAKNSSLFVSGWRPSIGWICSASLAYQYILRPILTWTTLLLGYDLPPMPGIDANLWELILGMLGIGGLRTVEKLRGVATK